MTLTAGACTDPAPAPATTLPAETPEQLVTQSVGRSYQRGFAFFSGDSIVVSWASDARSQPGGVRRRHRGWLHRGGTWDAFLDARWVGPPTREPWRLVPHGPVRLVVSAGEALDRLVFDDPPRSLELRFGDAFAEWAGPQGQVVRLADALVSLPDREVRGTVVDLNRTWSSEEGEPGDWMFLVSGDSVQVVLEETTIGLPYRAWARWGSRDLQWPSVQVEWPETRAFETARREVPSRWLISTPDGDISAELDILSSELEAGRGEGPLLPVDGLFQVRGTMTLDGRRPVPVYGLVRHRQS